MRKLNGHHPYSQIVTKTICTLNKHKNFVITIFDNLQVNIPIKFQRFGLCANMAIATCRMFAEPVVCEYIDNMILPNKEVCITYIDQAIPSPYGMPEYEDIKFWLD